MLKKLFLTLSILLVSSFSQPIHSVPITPVFQQVGTITDPYSAFSGVSSGNPWKTVGFTFNISSTININALGAFSSIAFPLAGPRLAGIWHTNTQQLLGSVLVSPSSPYNLGNFVYSLIPTVTLLSGNNYTIGIVANDSDRAPYMSATGYGALAQSLLGKRTAPSNSTALVFPATNYNNGCGRGSVSAALIVTPEPSSYLMMGGFLVVALLLMKKRKVVSV